MSMGMDISTPVTYRSLFAAFCYICCIAWLIAVGAAQDTEERSGVGRRITYCGRAVSVDAGHVPAEGITQGFKDPILCLERPGGFRSAQGLMYTECMEHEVELESGVQIPMFAVDIGNLTGRVVAHLEPGHVRGICMSSIFDTGNGWFTGHALSGLSAPRLACFHPAEPVASFLLRTCRGDNCTNHFFLASTGPCNKPETLGVGGISLAVAGLPSPSTAQVVESPPTTVPKKNEVAPKETGGKVEETSDIVYCARSLSLPAGGSPHTDGGIAPSDDPIRCIKNPGLIRKRSGPSFTGCLSNRAVLKVTGYTSIYQVEIGHTLVHILASIVQKDDTQEVCLDVLFQTSSAPGTGSNSGQPCFELGRPAALFLTTTCHEKVCTDHYFLAASGRCPSHKGQGRRMFFT